MPDLTPSPERRRNLKLRALFEEAYARLAPFLDTANTWGGVSLQHLAYRTLREVYPDLDPDEVHQLVVASVRVHDERSRRGATPPEATA